MTRSQLFCLMVLRSAGSEDASIPARPHPSWALNPPSVGFQAVDPTRIGPKTLAEVLRERTDETIWNRADEQLMTRQFSDDVVESMPRLKAAQESLQHKLGSYAAYANKPPAWLRAQRLFQAVRGLGKYLPGATQIATVVPDTLKVLNDPAGFVANENVRGNLGDARFQNLSEADADKMAKLERLRLLKQIPTTSRFDKAKS